MKACLKPLLILLVSTVGWLSVSWAAIDTYPFQTEEQRQRFKQLTDELRCPKCQNQNIADSNAPIAKDLREEIYRQLLAGQSNQAIADFMVARYGEFVLYRPAFSKKTWLLWIGPFILLVVGAGIFYRLIRKGQSSTAPASASLSEAEQQQIEAIIHQHEEPKS
ncbi:cytochrome c-type biogenesis protein CcmH [Endozoicomonas sp. SM1973]|uniref:Cytochrome c-type biogenesis protein n=1 Tax=Spartinivicinus marinus TaxID=2994442 RepID=A0A853I411_9GAMM|nr:cytochrome c-type biogenesis protein [Spartinivicinus marinus]MCX4028959.1 cytochrome c-type biogenesis protein CcmH [Spartinivicinus marinus]NYZ65458.1 cytochrome c-type biogenesis protein CcmH [Spartinivicinus marinus]